MLCCLCVCVCPMNCREFCKSSKLFINHLPCWQWHFLKYKKESKTIWWILQNHQNLDFWLPGYGVFHPLCTATDLSMTLALLRSSWDMLGAPGALDTETTNATVAATSGDTKSSHQIQALENLHGALRVVVQGAFPPLLSKILLHYHTVKNKL